MLNVWYSDLIRRMTTEQRAAFDKALWSDPERERAILRALA